MASFRPMRREDVPAALALVRAVLAEFGLVFGVGSSTDADVERLPDAYVENGGGCWIAEVGDETGAYSLVGMCGVYPLGDGVYELRKMYLAPSARGRGLGKRLLEASVAFVRDHGGGTIVLDTTDDMQAAVGLYERNGFVRDDRWIRGRRCTRAYRLDLASAG